MDPKVKIKNDNPGDIEVKIKIGFDDAVALVSVLELIGGNGPRWGLSELRAEIDGKLAAKGLYVDDHMKTEPRGRIDFFS